MAATSTSTTARPTAEPRVDAIDAQTFKTNFDAIVDNVEKVIKGKTDIVRLSLVAMMCEGHILFEDVPGTGKSMLARALAQSMNATSNRVQCTPDILPGDITGSSIFDQTKNNFVFREGPIFCQILLADEVNRATPKTQSALLEAMAERRVSSDQVTRDLPRPFFVLATQNPVETAGTFPLPEAQLDRFLFKLSMGYLSREHELEVMFDNSIKLQIEDLGAVIEPVDVQAMINYASGIEVSTEVGFYIVDLVNASRTDPAVSMGGSPRASIALLRASRVLAASDGRTNVYPDDVRAVLRAVLAHRVVLNPESLLRGETIDAVLERITGSVRAPLHAADRPLAAASA
ncbi:MAG: MoxR family ATPase [Actinobacteria bacterium]|nr:MoxR family ATPase [Actinomycetota bacterium]